MRHKASTTGTRLAAVGRRWRDRCSRRLTLSHIHLTYIFDLTYFLTYKSTSPNHLACTLLEHYGDFSEHNSSVHLCAVTRLWRSGLGSARRSWIAGLSETLATVETGSAGDPGWLLLRHRRSAAASPLRHGYCSLSSFAAALPLVRRTASTLRLTHSWPPHRVFDSPASATGALVEALPRRRRGCFAGAGCSRLVLTAAPFVPPRPTRTASGFPPPSMQASTHCWWLCAPAHCAGVRYSHLASTLAPSSISALTQPT